MGAKRGTRVGCRELGEELRKSSKGHAGARGQSEQGLCNELSCGIACTIYFIFLQLYMLKWFVNDEVAIQVQRKKGLIEEEQVQLSLVDENVDVEHFLQ